jgi:hypothetical protein
MPGAASIFFLTFLSILAILAMLVLPTSDFGLSDTSRCYLHL